ncbi:LamG-like jellyroll fold domain-containing protein [Candidatus Poribacteria bacterium]
MRAFTVVFANIITMLVLISSSVGFLDMDHLILYWDCRANKENKLVDISGNGWDAVIKAGKSEWVEGKFEGGIRLQQAYAQVDGNIIKSIEETGEITLMLWFRMNQHADFDGLISIKPPKGDCCPYRLMLNSNSNPFWSAGNPVDKSLPSFAFELNRWYSYALSADKDSTRIYVDSKLIGEQAENFKLPVFKEVTVYLGTGENPGTHPVEDATFDEVMIWDKALDEIEIENRAWHSGFTQVVEPEGMLTTTWGSIRTRY